MYPSFYSPTYSAAKHGVVGFMRSISRAYFKEGVRVNAICPGVVKTGLLSMMEWEHFPEKYFTDIESIVRAVGMLVDGGEGQDLKERRVESDGSLGGGDGDEGTGSRGKMWGQAVEISGRNWYLRGPPKWCDEGMRRVMDATDTEELVH